MALPPLQPLTNTAAAGAAAGAGGVVDDIVVVVVGVIVIVNAITDAVVAVVSKAPLMVIPRFHALSYKWCSWALKCIAYVAMSDPHVQDVLTLCQRLYAATLATGTSHSSETRKTTLALATPYIYIYVYMYVNTHTHTMFWSHAGLVWGSFGAL